MVDKKITKKSIKEAETKLKWDIAYEKLHQSHISEYKKLDEAKQIKLFNTYKAEHPSFTDKYIKERISAALRVESNRKAAKLLEQKKHILKQNKINLKGDVNKKFNDLISDKIPGLNKIDRIKIKGLDLSGRQEIIKKLIKKANFTNDTYYTLKVSKADGTFIYHTLTSKNKKKIIDRIRGDQVANFTRSDGELIDILNEPSIVNIELLGTNAKILRDKFIEANPNKQFRRDGKFFNHKHLINDPELIETLKELQIFYNDDPIDYNENCFIKSLIGQLDETIINKLKTVVKVNAFKSSHIKKLAIDNNFYVELLSQKPNDVNNRRVKKIGDPESVNKAKICLLDDHYFKYIEDVGCTSYYLKNYDEIKNKTNPKSIIKYSEKKKKYDRNNKRHIDSFNLVMLLLENKEQLLKDLTIVEEVKENNDNIKGKLLNLVIKDNCQLMEFKNKPEYKGKNIIVFDFETYCDENGKHIPYLVCCDDVLNDEKKCFIGSNCGSQLLEYLVVRYGYNTSFEALQPRKELLMYAHNMTYDSSFLFNLFNSYELLEKDGLNVSVNAYKSFNSKHLKFLLKDSWRIIPDKVSKFETIFQLDKCEKECMYYEMYNSKTINHIAGMSKEELDSYILDFDNNSIKIDPTTKINFYNNLKKWNCINKDGTYDLLAYSKIYCEMDVRIVKEGLIKFRDLWKQITIRDGEYIDIFNYYSLPSIAFDYFKYWGCFDDCYELNGVLGDYFMNMNHGGRVMLSENKKNIVDTGRVINDYDGVSLYPSSMHLMDGFLKGMPKLIDLQTFSKERLNMCSYYFIKVKITKVGFYRKLPLFSKKNDGVKQWTNDVLGMEYYFDKYQLEDAIEFHGVDFELIEGYYFDDGFNTKIKDEIKKVFDMRLKAKKDKNEGLSTILKLLMNSSYGKLGQKAAETNTEIIRIEKLEEYFIRNYNIINKFQVMDGGLFVKIEKNIPIIESYSMPHLSCQVLSYSKRIMNQVICTAEDNNIDVFYQDTDSMHMYDDQVKKLEEAFMIKYNRVLTGKNLGQFHCDFEPVNGYHEAVSKRFIGLGKKCYVDELESTNNNTGSKKISYHIRMKGVSTNAILYKAKELDCTPYDIYLKLYNGEKIQFDLSVDNKVRFQKKCGSFFRGESLKRTISF